MEAALYPSGFTQLSNIFRTKCAVCESFVPLWIYTALKHEEGGEYGEDSFVPLWIYTALKPHPITSSRSSSFVPLWIYTALKRLSTALRPAPALYPSGFTQLSNRGDVRKRGL